MYVSFNSNTTGTASGTGTACPSGAHQFTFVFSGVYVAQSLVFCVVFCRSLFDILSFSHLVIVLSVLLRFMDSDYPFGIFKLFPSLYVLCKTLKLTSLRQY